MAAAAAAVNVEAGGAGFSFFFRFFLFFLDSARMNCCSGGWTAVVEVALPNSWLEAELEVTPPDFGLAAELEVTLSDSRLEEGDGDFGVESLRRSSSFSVANAFFSSRSRSN